MPPKLLLPLLSLLATLAPLLPASAEFRLLANPALEGLEQPVGMAALGDGKNTLAIIEKVGRVRMVENGKLLSSPLLDISELVSKGSEQGLLGIAFPPDFGTSRRMYLYYTDRQGDSVLARFQVPKDFNDEIDAESIKVILKVVQPRANHNGGQITFGPDGFLYLGLGDGGGAGDPEGNGQNLQVFLGKILRIDVSGPTGFTAPKDNPFVGHKDAAPEIWAYGFRNPWRFSFDRTTKRLFSGDVGQNEVEEIDIVEPGKNYGWNRFEGTRCFKPPCPKTGMVEPIYEYPRADGITVIGGYVYRGTELPELVGRYLFADFGSKRVWSLQEQGDGKWVRQELMSVPRAPTSFGEDERGELYILTLEGTVYQLARANPSASGTVAK